MRKPIDIGTKFRDKIATKYPAIDNIDVPDRYIVNLIDHRKDEIEKYDVIFWHRLLRNIYQEPTEIECEFQKNDHEHKTNIQTASFRKIQGEENSWEVKGDEALATEINACKIKPFPINWKYLIRLPSGRIVELGTMDRNTIFRIAQVILPESSINHSSEEAKKFINLLLDEANRVREQLFKPTREFERQEGIKRYLLLVLSTLLCEMFIGQFFEERQVLTHFPYRV